jgi:hypothetical protein
MLTLARSACSLLLVFLAGCGGPTRESLAEDGITVLEQLTTAFSGIKDEATAKAALPQIEKAVAKMIDVKARTESLPEPTPEEAMELAKKMGERGTAAGMKWMETMQSLERLESDPKIGPVLKPVLERLKKVQ